MSVTGEFEYLTADQALAESDAYCATRGNPALAEHMRAAFAEAGVMPPAVLNSLHLKRVTMYQRKRLPPIQPQPPIPDLRAILLKLRTFASVVLESFDLDAADCQMEFSAASPTGRTSLATITLADVFTEADTALAATAPEEPGHG